MKALLIILGSPAAVRCGGFYIGGPSHGGGSGLILQICAIV